MEKDYELEQIFQEARENYTQRLFLLKNSLRSISDTELPGYSESPCVLNTKFKLGKNSAPHSQTSSNMKSNHFSNFEQKSSKHLPVQLKQLENTVESLRRKNEEAELVNGDLRRRLKEATSNMLKIQGSTVKQPEDYNNSKIHYKKKISALKQHIRQISNDNQVLVRDLSESKRREQGTKDICKSQISEITEEFASKLKQATVYYKEELKKIRNNVEIESQEKQNLESEAVNLKNTIKNLHNEQKKETGEFWRANKELKEALNNKEAYLEESQRKLDVLAEDYRIKTGQMQEEISLRSQMNQRLNGELEDKSRVIAKLKGQLENFKFEPSIETHSRVLLDQLISNNKALSQKTEKLENEKQMLNLELSKLNEALKNSEISNKVLKTSIEIQEKEIKKLNKTLIEATQSNEENIKELKDQYKNKLFSKIEESHKQYKNFSAEYREICESLKISEEKEEDYKIKIEILQKELNQSDQSVSRFKAINSKLSLSQSKLFHIKDTLSSQIEKIRPFIQVLSKLLKQHLSEFQKNLVQSTQEIMKYVNFGIENQKNLNEFEFQQLKNDYSLAKISLEKANKQVSYLQEEIILCKEKMQTVENGSFLVQEQLKTELQLQQRGTSKSLNQILGLFNNLEQEFESRFEELIDSVIELRQSVNGENSEKTQKYLVSLEYCQSALDFYKTKLSQIENEKIAEKDWSEAELMGLQMKLSKTLKDLRD